MRCLLITPAAAQDHEFPTPGNATVPGYVTMCIVANQAVPCAASGGGITAGTTTTSGCGAGGVLFSSASLVQCDTGFVYAGGGGDVTLAGHLIVPAGAAGTPALQLGGASSTGIFGSTTTFIIGTSGVAQLTLVGGQATFAATTINFPSANSVNWNADVFMSRSAAGNLRIGATAGTATGNILVSGIGPGTIYSAAGTAVPACAAGTNGWTIVASDVTTVTYRAAYVSGGTNLSRLFCVSGTGWLAD